MNGLLKSAFIIFSESAHKSKEPSHPITPLSPEMRLQEAEEFLHPKKAKPLPGSILANLDERLELIELKGELARLELSLGALKKSRKYPKSYLNSITLKIASLKGETQKRLEA